MRCALSDAHDERNWVPLGADPSLDHAGSISAGYRRRLRFDVLYHAPINHPNKSKSPNWRKITNVNYYYWYYSGDERDQHVFRWAKRGHAEAVRRLVQEDGADTEGHHCWRQVGFKVCRGLHVGSYDLQAVTQSLLEYHVIMCPAECCRLVLCASYCRPTFELRSYE